MSISYQFCNLIPGLTLFKNVALGERNCPNPYVQHEALALVELSDRLDLSVFNFRMANSSVWPWRVLSPSDQISCSVMSRWARSIA